MRVGFQIFWWALLLAAEVSAGHILLVDESGRNRPPRLGDRSPFALLEAVAEERTVETCNAFHFAWGNSQSGLATAAHCVVRAREKKASVFRVHYFDNRTGRQAQADLSHEDILYVGAQEKGAFPLDIALLKLPPSVQRRWDRISWEGKQGEEGPYSIRGFEYRGPRDPNHVADVLNDRARAVFKVQNCEGSLRKSPRISFEWWMDREIKHRKILGIDYSGNGLEVAEKRGNFLEGCEIGAGLSGSLVTGADNRAVGILHTGISAETVRKVWNQGLRLNFAKEALKRLGDVELEKGKYRFGKVSALKDSEVEYFALDSSVTLYGVALLFSEWLDTDPKIP